jgi:hypothetical protein
MSLLGICLLLALRLCLSHWGWEVGQRLLELWLLLAQHLLHHLKLGGHHHHHLVVLRHQVIGCTTLGSCRRELFVGIILTCGLRASREVFVRKDEIF